MMNAQLTIALRVLLIAATGALTGCGGDTERERVFQVRGIVRAPYADGTISIQHEKIPDFMPAMTMPFHADETEAKGLAVGDHVEFEFRVGEQSRATKFRRVRQADSTAESPPTATIDAAPVTRRLREGDAVPAFSLVDQEGRQLTEADFLNRRTVVTFVFTRCPVPEFCPLIARKFQELQNALLADPSGSAQTRLLSISIDPEHDRPEILRSYGQSLGADFSRWRFATGSIEEIQKLTRRFAVHTEDGGGGVLDHTLATALIGPDGKLVEIWRGNAWKPEEILARLSGS